MSNKPQKPKRKMPMMQRFKRLSFWHKLSAIGSIASIIAILTAVVTILLPTRNSTPEKHEEVRFSDGVTRSDLRSIPQRRLITDSVKAMIIKNDFFDSTQNLTGNGFPNRFNTLRGNKVILDSSSYLLWQQSGSSTSVYYLDAHKYINSLNTERFAGQSNWRLPTLEEGMSLMEPKKNRAMLHIEDDFDGKQQHIWTADTANVNNWQVWAIDFKEGYAFQDRVGNENFVKAVASVEDSE